MIRRLASALWRGVTWPFRVIAFPFRRARDFLRQEPEEAATTDVFARTFEHPSLLLEHVEALRHHLLRSVIFLVLTTALSFTTW